MDKSKQIHLWYFLGALLAVMLLQDLLAAWSQTEAISYSKFETLLRDHKLDNLVVTETLIRGEMKDGSGKVFVTARVAPEVAQELEKYGVTYSGGTENTILRSVLSWVVPAAVFFGLWMLVVRRMAEKGLGGGFMTIGQNKAKVYVEKDTKVTFADVAGVDEAKAELVEIVNFLKDPQRYGRLGARIPRGVLLVGPPGTGKTLLARAVAGEAGVPFFSISGSEFVEMFVGVGAARVRDLFEQARTKAPAIIFIDELDALGRARGVHPLSGGHDEKEQTLNQLLAELDGFDPSAGLVLLAATNRPEILDPALLRAGRFDRQVLVDRPDRFGRVQILKVHLKKVKLAADIDAERLAALTAGFSGADLANLVNEAALLATRRNAAAVAEEDFVAAIERIVAGLEKRNRLLNPHERKVVAYHESGHALVALTLPGADTVQKISIIPRGIGALGYTIQRPTEDRYLMTKAELENRMAVLLAGRAAELLVFEELSTGAADDLVKATDIARSIATRFGMTEQIGQVALEEIPRNYLGVTESGWPVEKKYSEETAREIDLAVKTAIERALDRAGAILKENRTVLERMATALLEKETLTEAEIQALLNQRIPRASALPVAQQGILRPAPVQAVVTAIDTAKI